MEIPNFDLWSETEHGTLKLARSLASRRRDVETPFYIIDFDDILSKLDLWNEVLPRIRPHYAVKCNSNRVILKLLVEHGLDFDCATKNEIDLMLSLGVDPSRIVYAHTIKCPSYIRYAKQKGINRMTFDNINELDKIKQFFPEALLILRLRVVEDDRYKMSDKFGCLPVEVRSILEATKRLNLHLFGISFHVGCQNQNGETYTNALQLCKTLEIIAKTLGFAPKFIDIGGGFDCNRGNELAFRKTADSIRKESDRLFPASAGYDVISEPGTFFVGSAASVCARVVGKRKLKGITQLHVNESAYVSFINALYNDSYLHVQPLKGSEVYTKYSRGENLTPTRIYGMTCDGVDIILPLWHLPEIEVGDWILFYNQGAYSEAMETDFNMLEKPDRFYRSSSARDIQIAKDFAGAEIAKRLIEAFDRWVYVSNTDEASVKAFRALLSGSAGIKARAESTTESEVQE